MKLPRLRSLLIQPSGRDWATILAGAIAVGLFLLIYDGLRHRTPEQMVSALLLVGACLLVGALLGFLFGIPRSLQAEEQAQPIEDGARDKGEARRLRSQYRANTNLEQISDWLTKIIVGVGLTQLNSIPDFAARAGTYFGSSIGTGEGAARAVVSLIFFFTIAGFLFTYLWTRLFLGNEFARADLGAVTDQVREEVVQAQEEQSQIDAKALSLCNQFLSVAVDGNISADDLKKAVSAASPPIKVQVYYQARTVRSQSWQNPEDRWRIDRTIPIFEALIAGDRVNRFHQNHGQLGFALKDCSEPDYGRAERELSTAIRLRGSAAEAGWQIYEFNRAICLIMKDEDFRSGRKSAAESYGRIISDLRVAMSAIPDLYNHDDILRWIALNGAEEDLKL